MPIVYRFLELAKCFLVLHNKYWTQAFDTFVQITQAILFVQI